MKGDIITLDNEKYQLICTCNEPFKYTGTNCFGIKLGIFVKRLSDDKIMCWSDFKGTYGNYLATQISNYIQNSINGRKTFYWDFKQEVEE